MTRILVILVLASIACSINLAPVQQVIIAPQVVEALPTPSPAPFPLRRAVVTASRSVNIREEATEHSRDLGELYNGKTVWVAGCSEGWADIMIGWVNARYLGGICK